MTSPVPSIEQIAPQIRSGAVSPVDLVRGCLDRIESRLELNAFITVMADSALECRGRRGTRDRAGRYRGPLHGMPISVKDLVDVAGTPTTSGSAVPPRLPAHDAPIVSRLRRGRRDRHRQNQSARVRIRHDQRGVGVRTRASSEGSARSRQVARAEARRLPWSKACASDRSAPTPGARSGSRRRSAGRSVSNPRYGELPCDGIVPLSTTLDHVGPMAQKHGDVAIMFEAMRGARDPEPVPAHDRPMVLGVPEAYFCDRLNPEVRAALARTRQALGSGRPRGPDDRRSTTPHGPPTCTCTSCCRKRPGTTRRSCRTRRSLFARRASAAGDGAVCARGRLRARDATARGARPAR